MKQSKRNKTGESLLSPAQLEQRRNAGRKRKTMTDAAIKQRQEAASESTGPVTEDGKAISSRNSWKTGEHSYVAKANLWNELGIGFLRPCKSTCPKYPCSLVDDEITKPGGDCGDKQVYVEAFSSIMETLHSGDVKNMHGVMASQVASAVNLIQQLHDHINSVGVLMGTPLTTKEGTVIRDDEGKPFMIYKRNPLLNDIPKMMRELGINLPELMATPKAVAQQSTNEDAANAITDLFGRMGRASGKSGPVQRHEKDITGESKRIE